MITKAQVKDIRALSTSKGRKEQGAFLVEGDKLAREWLVSARHINYVVGERAWIESAEALLNAHPEAKVIVVSPDELERVSTQQMPNGVLLVVPIPAVPGKLPVSDWCLVLDKLQDPGNMGTIIRIADWFGINHIVSSPDSVDYYNPKVVAAAMGGHLRVQLHVADITTFLSGCTIPVIAATLHGTSLKEVEKPTAAALVIGNESKGISDSVLQHATIEVTIPKRGGAESLNAAVSAGIILSTLSPGA